MSWKKNYKIGRHSTLLCDYHVSVCVYLSRRRAKQWMSRAPRLYHLESQT